MLAVDAAAEMRCSVFIGAGSQAEYGRFEGKLNANVPTFPENGYGIAKLCAGQMTRIRCNQKGIKHIWTRILSVYGPYDGSGTMVMSTIEKLLSGARAPCTKGNRCGIICILRMLQNDVSVGMLWSKRKDILSWKRCGETT